MITTRDAHLHEADTNDPYWNESSWISFSAPERGLNGAVYVYHRPNAGYSFGGVFVWDPSGDNSWTCPLYDFWATPMAPGTDMYDFSFDNGLRAQCVEEQSVYRFGYKGPGGEADLVWRAFMPPFEAGFPAGLEDWGSCHYEQPGRMTGHIIVRGERIDIDCWSLTDRSWGTRRRKSNPRGSLSWGILSEQHAFGALSVDDGTSGSDCCGPDPVITGWYVADGTAAKLVRGTRAVTRGTDGWISEVRVDCSDELGRSLVAVGTPVSRYYFDSYPDVDLRILWSLIKWELNGETAFGEEQDWWPTNMVQRFLQGLPR